MPTVITRGAVSAQGYGYAAKSTAANYIEDVFSTYLYTGNAGTTNIPNGIRLNTGEGTSAGWLAKLSSASDIGRDSSNNVYVCSGTTLVKYNSSGVLQWQTNFANSGALVSVAVTGAGDAYVVGYQSSPAGFGIVKFNSSGVVQWQRTLASTYSPGNSKIALDSSENVYICGWALDSGGTYYLSYIAKYNLSGTVQWQKLVRVGSSTSDATQLSDIASDSSGNIYVCGYTRVFSTDVYYYVIQKYNTSGTLQWERRVAPSTNNGVGWSGIALSSDGADVYVGGIHSSGPNKAYLVKYNSSGALQWQRGLSTGTLESVTVDSSNNVYAIGRGSDSTKVGIYKYDSSGTLQWQRALQSNSAVSQSSQTIATTSTGDILISYIQSNGYFAKLPADGSGLGVYSLGTATSDTIAYVTSNLTTATPTQTDSAGSLSSSTSSLTNATSSYTSSAGSLTSTITALNQVSSASTSSGGLVWIKDRSGANNHALYDTGRGATLQLSSNLTNASSTESTGLTNFLPNGFTLGALSTVNANSTNYTSWTFRKQAKFFDVVTYTGDGTNTRNVNHNLGSAPGAVFVKATSTTSDWFVWHRSLAAYNYMTLNTTAGAAAGYQFGSGTQTFSSSVFTVGAQGPGPNVNGVTYVAYLFAHDAGGFGAAGTDNVISCGSFTTSASGLATVTLGYEPQWLLIKRTTASTFQNWRIIDTMRGCPVGNYGQELYPNVSDAEFPGSLIDLTATGFNVGPFLTNSATYIYIAIRRGPMKTPTSGTSVFSPNTSSAASGTKITTNFPVDAQLGSDLVGTSNRVFVDRLRGISTNATGAGQTLLTNSTVAEATDAGSSLFWDNTGFQMNANFGGAAAVFWNFRRAPGFFDEVCYTGTGANRTVSHNLGVAPELMIVKNRSSATNWFVYSSALGATKYLIFDTAAASTATAAWNDTAPTASVFTVGSSGSTNGGAQNLVAYLFATCPNVSKVGSYTGSAALQTIDCGFTSGARFVLIKRTDSTGDWYLWDSARGISSGNDPYVLINSNVAEVTGTNYVDTTSVGFQVTAAASTTVNISTASYIFLAIA